VIETNYSQKQRNQNGQKERKKLAQILLGTKPDKRSLKNLETIFNHIINNQEFSGPELRRRGVGTTWFYENFVPRMVKCGVIEEGKEPKTSGRGTTQYYRASDVGLLFAAYYVKDIATLKTVLQKMITTEENPITQFSLKSFITNYSDEVVLALFDRVFHHITLGRVGNEKTLMEEIQELFINGLFDASLFSIGRRPTNEQADFFNRNVEFIEKAPERNYVFWYNKMVIESHLLNVLQGKKLKSYFESLWKTPTLFHVPCLNEKCNEVIVSDTLVLPRHCDECRKQSGSL